MADPTPYEVLAIRYAVNNSQRSPHNFIGGDAHDQPMPLDYFIWLVRGAGGTFVVDTGYDKAMADKRKRTHLGCPGETLKKISIDPGTVSDVIITHMHYDHCGNHDLFPRARYHVQDAEMAYATGRCMCHGPLRAPFEADDVASMVHKVFTGRVAFHDGEHTLAPGLTLHRVGGHTNGMQIVRVWTRRGWLVLASDASHFYANMEQQRAFPVLYNLGDMLEGYKTCYELASRPENVIPGHDPLVTKRYPSVSKELESMVMRLDADPM